AAPSSRARRRRRPAGAAGAVRSADGQGRGVTVRVGFYGAGFITRFHVAALAASAVEHRIVAVHDPDADRAAAFAAEHGAAAVGEAELLGMVDAVYVATWTSEHPRLVAAAAAAGVAVFCEKPLAVDAPTAERM